MDDNASKFPVTFAAIQALQNLLAEFAETDAKNKTYDFNLNLTRDRLDKIQRHLLKGE
jgi:hypothetical protein